MSPAQRGGRARRGGKRKARRGGGLVRIAFALLAAAAAAMAGVAMWFGFLPGPWSGRAPADTTVADSLAFAPVAGPSRLAIDSAAGAQGATDSLPVPSAAPAAGGAAGAIALADSAAGDALYRGAGKCVGCHGAVGEGASTLGPSLRDSAWTSGDGSVAGIERVIANGAPAGGAFRIAMPAYASQLGIADIQRVASYVYTLSHPGAVAADTLPTPAGATSVDAPPSAGAGITTSTPARVARPTVPPPPTPLPSPVRPRP